MSGRVLFIGGWGRSGSTLLDRMLGQVDGVFSVGEVRELWERGLKEDRPCGCDLPFRECGFWAKVGEVAYGGWDRVDLDEALRLRFSLDRPWTVPLLASPRLPRRQEAPVRRYVGLLEDLYRAILEVSGAEVIVDSSKIPSHAFLLRRIPGLDLRVVHLVRDSRGVAFSWQKQVLKKVTTGSPRYLQRYGPVRASVRWLLYNGETRALRRLGVPYLLVRYEDLIARPVGGLRRILRHAGIDPASRDLSFVGDDGVRLFPNHTVDGNPMRFQVGAVPLRLDEEWRREMDPRDQAVVTAATLPGLVRYRYRVRPGGAA